MNLLHVIAIGLGLGFLVFGLTGCTPVSPIQPLPADCQSACEHGQRLECAWSKPTPKGVPCFEVCESANRILPWPYECIVGTRTCEEADACK